MNKQKRNIIILCIWIITIIVVSTISINSSKRHEEFMDNLQNELNNRLSCMNECNIYYSNTIQKNELDKINNIILLNECKITCIETIQMENE